jgi:hypothetical protein
MPSLFWRIIIAVVAVVLIGALLEPLSRILGFPLTGDPLRVIQICIAGIAVFYVIGYPRFFGT